jgi:hypothetical protein
MYYSDVEFEYIATSFSPARTNLAVKLLTLSFPDRHLVGVFTSAIDISPNNGLIKMIQILKKCLLMSRQCVLALEPCWSGNYWWRYSITKYQGGRHIHYLFSLTSNFGQNSK